MTDYKSIAHTIRDLNKKLYNFYQYHWLIEHEYSIRDFIKSLDEYRDGKAVENIEELFVDWENDHSSNGSLYPCYTDFCTHELMNEELMEAITNSNFYAHETWRVLKKTKYKVLTEIMYFLGYSLVFHEATNAYVYSYHEKYSIKFHSLIDLTEWIKKELKQLSDVNQVQLYENFLEQLDKEG